jgi:mediator of RNA polymerase II transcription subunit 21
VKGNKSRAREKVLVVAPFEVQQLANTTVVEPYPTDVFKAGQKELAQDLIVKEQQIEALISMLPGLDNSERDQEDTIRQLEEELKVAETRRKEAVREKEVVLSRLESVIRSVKRP